MQIEDAKTKILTMSDKDLVNSPNTGITNTSNTASQTRARSFKVSNVSVHNYAQYARTVKAYALAGMSFHDIANAGDFLEDEVERAEIDAPLQQNWKNMAGEIAEDESKILAWQARGETVSITNQLSSPAGVTGKEVVTISKDLITVEQNESTHDLTVEVSSLDRTLSDSGKPTTSESGFYRDKEQTIEVIEGIKVSLEESSSLPNSTMDSQLENNPYLQPIDLRKAA